ncbi:hypothetical protein [Aromatoleum bremense]|uniref:hypothetical protein n=1 Tax=Aromatoleum bremense TaxID=76115 RepID=UPI001FD2BD3D
MRREIMAGPGNGLRKLVAGELHAVAGIADEADDDAFDFLYRPGFLHTMAARRGLVHRHGLSIHTST